VRHWWQQGGESPASCGTGGEHGGESPASCVIGGEHGGELPATCGSGGNHEGESPASCVTGGEHVTTSVSWRRARGEGVGGASLIEASGDDDKSVRRGSIGGSLCVEVLTTADATG
jgi:hypothetical protein